MLQGTISRASGPAFEAPLVVAGEAHRFLVKDQLEAWGNSATAILLEPEGRNTAGAVAISAEWILTSGADDIMLVMLSDHLVRDVPAFHAAIEAALPAVEAGAIATFGIQPRSPETGYGYIEAGDRQADGDGVFAIARFVEKPDAQTAQSYLESGNFYWNGASSSSRHRPF
jgi:mannose-1-phosphate guanylyltransferase